MRKNSIFKDDALSSRVRLEYVFLALSALKEDFNNSIFRFYKILNTST